MIPISAATRVYLAVGATDLRKGFEGLSDLARQILEVDPISGHLCIFCNRRRTRIKVLFFDRTGFWVCMKKISPGNFQLAGGRGQWSAGKFNGRRAGLAARWNRTGENAAEGLVAQGSGLSNL